MISGQNENQRIRVTSKDESKIDADPALKQVFPQSTNVDSRMEVRPTECAGGCLHCACDGLELNIRASAQ